MTNKPTLKDWIIKTISDDFGEIDTCTNRVLLGIISDYLEAHKEPEAKCDHNFVLNKSDVTDVELCHCRKCGISMNKWWFTDKEPEAKQEQKLPKMGKGYRRVDNGDDIRYKFIIDDKHISGVYSLNQILKDNISEESILGDMEVCNCKINESVNCCEGDCWQFEDSEITGAMLEIEEDMEAIKENTLDQAEQKLPEVVWSSKYIVDANKRAEQKALEDVTDKDVVNIKLTKEAQEASKEFDPEEDDRQFIKEFSMDIDRSIEVQEALDEVKTTLSNYIPNAGASNYLAYLRGVTQKLVNALEPKEQN